MFWALALILLAVAGFTIALARLPRRPGAEAWTVEPYQLRGFIYVGGGGLAVLAVAVIVFGVTKPDSGIGEALAVLGFFGYALYVLIAGVITVVGRDGPRSPSRSRRPPRRRPQHQATRTERPGVPSGSP